MMTFIAICLFLIVLELGVAIAFFVAALITIRQAARAAETLAYRVDEEVDHIGTAMRSNWMRTLQTIANLAGSFWFGRRKDPKDS